MSGIVELVDRAQRGDAEAHGLIYRQYHDTLFWFIRKRVDSREIAEDLTQDVFVRALKSIGGFTWQGKDLGAWLMTIARNLVFDHHGSAHQRRTFGVGDYGDAGIVVRDTAIEGDPESAALDTIRNGDLRSALQYLPDLQRECLTNRYLRQLSVAETAEAMGRTEAAVKALTFRALQGLHRFLAWMVRR